MAKETEIKLHISDLKGFERKLKKMGAKTVGSEDGRVHELNTIFDTPEGGLAKHGQLLRIRTETAGGKGKAGGAKRSLLTFKQPMVRGVDEEGGRFKVREETETELTDSGALTKIFEGLGMRGWFSYEKYRTTWKLGAKERWAKDLLIEVDETPVGTYVELEGPPEAIDRAAEAFGFSRRDYLVKNYLTLYAEDCRRKGTAPGNMLFETKKR
ncbi:MAG TPA: class IV adenylate cyclase [Candidatus Acidoferrum sp.]|nr:class IV adenylate cyclase [Candidatus Acidoferrum sp.]